MRVWGGEGWPVAHMALWKRPAVASLSSPIGAAPEGETAWRISTSKCTEVWQLARPPTRQKHVARKRSRPEVKQRHPQNPFVPLASSNPHGHHFPDFWHHGLVLPGFDLKPSSLLLYLFFFLSTGVPQPRAAVRRCCCRNSVVGNAAICLRTVGPRPVAGVVSAPPAALARTGGRLRRGWRCRAPGARGLDSAAARVARPPAGSVR